MGEHKGVASGFKAFQADQQASILIKYQLGLISSLAVQSVCNKIASHHQAWYTIHNNPPLREAFT